MAIIKVAKSRSSIAGGINYITKESKTEENLIATKDCNPHTAIEEMKMTKEQWHKEGGNQYKHYIQSFNPKDNVTPEQAHEIGKKFMEHEKFKGHEIVMATHKDKNHIHNHFIVNSVNHETGAKFHEKKQELQMLKDYSNSLSKEYGLSIPTKGKEVTVWNQNKYRAIERGISEEVRAKREGDLPKYKSHVYECYKAVDDVRDKAINREDFIKQMKDRGFETTWKDNKKHIVFQDKEGHKIRNTNLEKTFGVINDKKYGKEDLENGFRANDERSRGDQERNEPSTIESGRSEGITNSTESNRELPINTLERRNDERDHSNERIERDRDSSREHGKENEFDIEQFSRHLEERNRDVVSAYKEQSDRNKDNDQELLEGTDRDNRERNEENERAERQIRENIEKQRTRDFDEMER